MSLNKLSNPQAQTDTDTDTDTPFEADNDILAEPEQVAVQEDKQVAVAPGMPAPTTKFETEMSEEGFEGMELDRWSFPQIKLDDGQFMDEEDTELGKEFECIVLATKPKWVLKNTKRDDKDAESHFSYDRLTDANSGELLAEVIADWKDAGWGHQYGQYLEAQAMITSGTLEGTIAILSIPPTSRTRLSGKFRRAQMQLGARTPREALLKCKVGKKTTNKNGQTFFPWTFEIVRKLGQGEIPVG